MSRILLTSRPSYQAVKQSLGDRTQIPESDARCSDSDMYEIYCSEMERLEHLVVPAAYVSRLRADGTFEKNGVSCGQDLLAVVLTLGAEGEAYVERLGAQGEHLRALVADAILNAWLFAADRNLQELLRKWCTDHRLGVRERMEPYARLPEQAQGWICGQFMAEADFDVRLTAGGMLQPEKSMGYVLLLDDKGYRFAVGHDCSSCERSDCMMRDTDGACEDMQKESRKMSKKQIQIVVEDRGKKITCVPGEPLLHTLRENGIRVDAPCGGSGRCGKCKIRVVSGELPVTQTDEQYLTTRELESGVRLACVARPESNLRIRILAKADRQIATSADVSGHQQIKNEPPADCAPDPGGYIVAVDIGTTTLAACLCGCTNGKVHETYTVTAVNRGRDYGADVLSRMEASVGGRRTRLQELLQEDVREMIRQLCAHSSVSVQEIHRIVIAANMTMVHLLMGYSCETLGRAPFVPVNAGLIRADALRILGDTQLICPVEILPAVCAFIGGDIVSGMLSLGMDRGQESALLLDVGTNGEMALRHDGSIYVTSAAAGPAFEGGGISCGCPSVPGAICGVHLEGSGQPVLRTIADAPPAGICGSGVLELVSELLTHGLIDETGLYVSGDDREKGYALAKNGNGDQICFTQGDIRAFQLAKSAIRAGVEALLSAAGITAADVSQVYLAGGFGVRMDEQAAVRTGLLPEQFTGRIRAVGNTSLAGAVYAGMHAPVDTRCQRLLAQCRQIVLADQPEFEENYLRYMNF